jgi:hypothetical protein
MQMLQSAETTLRQLFRRRQRRKSVIGFGNAERVP